MYFYQKIKTLLAVCLLTCNSLYAQDIKVSIKSATATSEQSGEGASRVIDGDVNTFWHSYWWSGAVLDTHSSVDLTITLDAVSLVDYVRYIPRQDRKDQGGWGEVEVFYNPNTSGSNFISIGTFQLNKKEAETYDFFLNGKEGVRCGQVKFTIRSGGNNHVTAAEIEAYQIDDTKSDLLGKYFTDDLYTQLKSGVTNSNDITDSDVKALVDNLLNDAENYKKFRVGEYKAYETIGTLQNRLKTNHQYSRYENPTGIYLETGQSCYVVVSGIGTEPVGLKIKNWLEDNSSSSYSLRNGLNYITATTEGNVFVNYYTDEFEKASNVKIHFINAPVRGYWNQETMDNEDWVKLLEGYSADDSSILFVQSEHAQLAYPISAWLQYCPTDIERLMTFYEKVQWAIRDMMGLDKYAKQTRNRQLFFATSSGPMAAGGEGAYCPVGSLGSIMTADVARFDFWGVGHEWGHNNQITPGFHWSGCGETTNNIYASWAQIHAQIDFGVDSYKLRLEDEVTGVNDYSGMRGGRMQTYFEEGLRKGIAWQLWDGPDYHGITPNSVTVTGRDAEGNDIGQVTTTSRNYDHFVKLAPFWQLNLWGTLAGKCPDIIPMVIENIRTAENYTATYNTNGKQQINWMRLACDNAEINLLPFFEKAGLLRPIHAYIEDYGAGWNIITEEMIDELKTYIETKGYPTFAEEINYINGHNYHIYRDKLELKTPTSYNGCIRNGNLVTVQHDIVQNSVAFETYDSDDKLVRITMYGLGSDDSHSYTQVLFPLEEGAAYIKAVGYDGTREKVYDVRGLIDSLKTKLSTLIDNTNALINQCGSVTYTQGEPIEVILQADKPTEDWYISSNADQNTGGGSSDGGGIAALVDNNSDTYFHTRWGGAVVDEPHYIQVDMGEGNIIQSFKFSYMARNVSPAPTEIVIYGSNDGKTFTDVITTITKAWNDYNNNGIYTSDVIETDNTYRYLRFTVTESNGPGNEIYGSYYFFGMKEFDLFNVPSSYSASLNGNIGAVTEDLLIAVYRNWKKAVEINNMTSPTEAQLYDAIDKLQAKYNLLVATQEETVTISSVGYSTLYLDYPVTIPEGVEVYVMSGIEGDYATLKRIEGVLPANNGVILRNEGTYTFKRVTEPATPVESNLLSGTAETIATNSVDGVVYTLQKNENGGVVFRRYNGANLNAKKAFLVLPASSEAQALRIRFADEEEITSIGNAVFENGVGLDLVYDLQGRRVVTPGKGFYIVNGKKMVIK